MFKNGFMRPRKSLDYVPWTQQDWDEMARKTRINDVALLQFKQVILGTKAGQDWIKGRANQFASALTILLRSSRSLTWPGLEVTRTPPVSFWRTASRQTTKSSSLRTLTRFPTQCVQLMSMILLARNALA